MRRYSTLLLICLLAPGFALTMGCGRKVKFESPEAAAETGRLLTFTGKVVYVAEEDVWGIIRDDLGTPANYRPTVMPEEFRQAGIRVRVQCRLVHQTIRTVDWGREIILESIERLD